MKIVKPILSFVLVLVALAASAQDRCFFYVRYDPAAGNSSAIASAIDSVVKQHPRQFAVMLSGGGRPHVADLQTWAEVRQLLLTQQNTPDVYADVEEQMLNELFAQLFGERVGQGNGHLNLAGDNDDEWVVTFIMAQYMYENALEMETVPLEFVHVNQLEERGVRVRWRYYDAGTKLHKCEEVPKNDLYSVKWSDIKNN